MDTSKLLCIRSDRTVVQTDGICLERLRHGPDRFEAAFGGDGNVTIVVNLSETQHVERIVRGRSQSRIARRGTATIIGFDEEARFVVTGVADIVKFVVSRQELTDYGVRGNVPFLFNEPHHALERLAYRAALALAQNDETFWMAGIGAKLASVIDPGLQKERNYFLGGLSPAALRRVIDLVESHLDLPRATSPSLKAMAAEVDLSVYHFAREFARTVGMTPYQYALRRRLERARDDMLREDDDMHTISARYGFASASHFVYRFRQELGVAPSRLRSLIAAKSRRSAYGKSADF